jgi:hypothetical protein
MNARQRGEQRHAVAPKEQVDLDEVDIVMAVLKPLGKVSLPSLAGLVARGQYLKCAQPPVPRET